VDYDKDGTNDIVGCGFDGFVEWFKGRGGSHFTAGGRLKDKNGKEIHDGQYWGTEEKKWMHEKDGQLLLQALLVDWDDDGDLDLLAAGRSGRLSLRLNEGSSAAPAFSPERTPVLVDGKPYSATGGSTPSPSFVDWDGDGLKDLVICLIAQKKVVWHKNIGRKGQPKFAGQELLLDFSSGGKPTACNRLSVADYDGDGLLDLIIGGGFYIGNSAADSGAWIYLQERK
jgi:hypothetical protein